MGMVWITGAYCARGVPLGERWLRKMCTGWNQLWDWAPVLCSQPGVFPSKVAVIASSAYSTRTGRVSSTNGGNHPRERSCPTSLC